MTALHPISKRLILTAAALTLLAACSGADATPDTTEPTATTAAPTTSAPETTVPPTTTTTVAPTTPTTTTTVPATDGPPPPVSATITDVENPDLDEATTVAEELWAHYQWWLAHPEEPLDSFIAPGGQADMIFTRLQDELVSEGLYMDNGLTFVEVLVAGWGGSEQSVALRLNVRRDSQRALIDVASDEIIEVQAEPSDELSSRGWGLLRQPDGTFRIDSWSGPFGEDAH